MNAQGGIAPQRDLPKALRRFVPLIVLGTAFAAMAAYMANTILGLGDEVFDSG